jgi:signal transduction histidine kinase
MGSPMRWPRRSLLLRIVTHGVVLLGASAAGFIAIVLLLVGSAMNRQTTAFGTWFVHEACRRAEAAPTLSEVRDFPAAVAVYDSEGQLLAASSSAPPPALSALERASVLRGDRIGPEPRGLTAQRCPQNASRYAVFGRPPAPIPLGRLALLVALLVAMIALGSIPLARSIVRPLRELSQAVRALGSGALDTRAEVNRRDELGALASAFNAMAGQLQDRLRMERELLANVSHELRTPLARTRVVLETALDDPARAPALLGEIGRDLAELERLTDDVLAALRLDFVVGQDPGGLELRLQPTALVGLVRHGLASFAETYPDREVSLELDGPGGDDDGGDGGDDVTILADPSLLGRLFSNLLDNARKYSSEAIVVRVARVAGGEVAVTVEDRGIGIDANELDRVFDPFFRGSRGRASGASGTGLGLTLCRRIVQAHRGRLTLQSEPGSGTSVIATFPRR